MNSSNIYELMLGLSILAFVILFIAICINVKYNKNSTLKRNGVMTTIALFCLGIAISCHTNIKKSYQEVYYLEYTVYYPNNTCKFKVDSCNHIYSYSSQGTNGIIYYSIPKKDTYSTETTAPIFINKIIKK